MQVRVMFKKRILENISKMKYSCLLVKHKNYDKKVDTTFLSFFVHY